MPEPEPEPPADPAVTQAYRRVAEAFAFARSFVFDRYPHGLPPREELTPSQRKRLEALERAEEDLDALRRARRESRRSCSDE